MPNETATKRRGGKPTPVSAAERAAIVAAYNEYGNVEKMKPHVGGFGETVIRRVLAEEGVNRKRETKLPPNRVEEVRAALAPLWEAGVGFNEMKARTGIGVENDAIRAIMAGIPRRPARSNWRLAEAADLHDDEADWRWVAGAFDVRGVIGRNVADHSFSLGMSLGQDRGLAEAVRDAAGVGAVTGKRARGATVYRWEVGRRADVQNVLRKIEPFLRIKQVMARRVLTEIEEIERNDG